MWWILFLAGAWILAYQRASLIVWTIAALVGLILFSYFSYSGILTNVVLWLVFLIIAIPLNIKSLRRAWITRPALAAYRRIMPSMSRTEREALEAGTIGWEGELFSGKLDLQNLLKLQAARLSAEEQEFLQGPVEELCGMINDWDITFKRRDLPPEVWNFIKKRGFFSLIIPKQYGGKEFSAYAHSQVLIKLAGCSLTVASTVSVPNSLGPAELLLHYGTTEQKEYYLPRLASGEEIPCFALTAPEAGSDAAAMVDYGIVCHGTYQGKETLGIRLNWNKRYITLAPVATVLGLAFKLFDPKHLLGEQEDIGITCALIPTNTQGVKIGRRHFPLDNPFQNGPTQGKEVFIPVDWIIGGTKMAGQGWRMLMECLSAGRAISLPSNATGAAKLGLLACGAYARIRKQFGVAIGYFEGVQQLLARIAGNVYTMDALRTFTAAAIDSGQKPSVASAISKYNVTERGRQVAIDAMDVHGGKGICLGPRNYLGRAYESTPISITVEGANILTRSLIIFGQGAMRCHPYVYRELQAALLADEQQRLVEFDDLLFRHAGFVISNKLRSLFLSLTGGRLVLTPVRGEARRYYQLLQRYSAAFAWISDVCLLSLGGELKRKEALSARLGDVLSDLYMLSAMLKQFHDQEAPVEDLPILHYACQTAIYHLQESLHDILLNLPNRFLSFGVRLVIFPWGRRAVKPTDHLTQKVAQLLLAPNATRSRLAAGCYMADTAEHVIGKMESALVKIIACEALEQRLSKAVKEKAIHGVSVPEQIASALQAGIINQAEAQQLQEAHTLRMEVIAVDDFDPAELSQMLSQDQENYSLRKNVVG